MANEIIYYEKYGPGKFSDNVDEIIYNIVLDGVSDDTVGDEFSGVYDLVLYDKPVTVVEKTHKWTFQGAILTEDDSGFVYVDYFDTPEQARKKMDEISEAYERFIEEQEEQEEEEL